MKIYLDNCCYNRLFDDRSNIKNYLEREAILIIMQKAYDGEEEIIGSDILDIEISKIINDEKRNDVEGVYRSLISNVVEIDEQIKTRAEEIIKLSNIKAFDSLHLASAEAGADMLLTTDMKFLRNCKKILCKVDVKNPIEYVMEVFDHDDADNKNNKAE